MNDEHIPLRIHSISQVEAYQVTAEELEAIKREGSEVGFYFHVSEFFLTAGFSFLIALLTTEIKSNRVFEVFVIAVMMGLSLGLVFGVKWYRSRGSVNAIFRRIEARQIGPSGDATHQIQPTEIAKLTPVAAPSMPISQAAAQPDNIEPQPQPARQEP